MEWVLFGVFMTFLFGSAILMLAFGHQEREENRAKDALDRMEGWPDDQYVSRFLSKAAPAEPDMISEDAREAAVRRVQSHIEAEQKLADEFVSHPSVENLYRRPPARGNR